METAWRVHGGLNKIGSKEGSEGFKGSILVLDFDLIQSFNKRSLLS